jgi:hypothetical protein
MEDLKGIVTLTSDKPGVLGSHEVTIPQERNVEGRHKT